MITNEKQYKSAKAQVENFQNSLKNFSVSIAAEKKLSNKLLELSKIALQEQLKDIAEEIREYEDLKEGRIVITEISNLSELPKTLIKARIANGLTQAELASRLNLKMQQIQRYEADEYSSASLKTLLRIASEVNLAVSADVQIKSFDDPQLVNAKNYPFKQMFQRGWFGNFVGTLNDAIKDSENLIEGLFENAGFKGVQPALNRQLIRSNSQPNEFALKAWYARVLIKAKDQRIDKSFDKNLLTSDWIGNLAKLSQEDDGLKKVPKYLKDVGIHFIIEPVLDGTLLDGAALLLDKQFPIIALTLRYDRLDNFWFVLFHEIAHIILHLSDNIEAIFDDLDSKVDGLEKDADEFALDALIPKEVWRTSLVRFRASEKTIINQAKALGINPALVAGRIRRETGQYYQFNDLIGQNKVRSQFANQSEF
jgi:HTH-type transcriptional regulator / antitoxin HigA